jgi:hypothetical protein
MIHFILAFAHPLITLNLQYLRISEGLRVNSDYPYQGSGRRDCRADESYEALSLKMKPARGANLGYDWIQLSDYWASGPETTAARIIVISIHPAPWC